LNIRQITAHERAALQVIFSVAGIARPGAMLTACRIPPHRD
jgi:hypothetical protein